jgi:transcriptional regulator with XRE-family HTH domain
MLKRVTSAQLRAARGLLGWTLGDLAQASGVHEEAFAILEHEDDAGDPHMLDRAVRSLEAAGAIFLANCMMAEGGPGVRLSRKGPFDEGLHPGELTSDNDG